MGIGSKNAALTGAYLAAPIVIGGALRLDRLDAFGFTNDESIQAPASASSAKLIER